MLFKFYDDQLFMVVADYDRRRTEGMSAEDMIAAISDDLRAGLAGAVATARDADRAVRISRHAARRVGHD